MNRLAIVSTHPIQYNAPLFRLLANDDSINLRVFYSKLSEEVKFDRDFGQEVAWDIPLLDGYEHAKFEASTSHGKRSLIDAIAAFNPKAILVYGWNFPGHWSTMRHFKGEIPVWFRGDSTLLDPLPKWKEVLRKLMLTAVYRSVDRAFYVGEANRRYFEWVGLREHQLIRAPHAIDNDFFQNKDEERRRLALEKRAELGIQKEDFVFLFVGKFESKKQPELVGEAFMKLNSKRVHLIYIGAGVLESHLKSKFLKHPNIHFVGFQNQKAMPIWYRVGNVLCLPSRGPGETWGLAVNEAMASGCMAIVSNRVGCGEDLATAQLPIVISNHGEIQEWIEAMDRCRALRNQKSHAQSIVDLFNLQQIMHALKQELSNV